MAFDPSSATPIETGEKPSKKFDPSSAKLHEDADEGGGFGRTLTKVADWADEPRPAILPLKRDGDKIGLATPQILAGPIGAIARSMRDIGSMTKGGSATPESLQAGASGVAGLLTGDAKTPLSVGGKAAGEIAKTAGAGIDQTIAEDIANTPIKSFDEKARERVSSRLKQDVKGSGVTEEQMMQRIAGARAEGKPMTLADAGEANIKGLAGHVARAPGESQAMARKFLADRDAGAGQRLTSDIDKGLATESAKQSAEKLADTRSEEAKPLFEKANAGGSVAPLEHQFGEAFDVASKAETEASKALTRAHNDLTIARGKQAKTSSVFSHADDRNPVAEEVKKASAAVAEADKRLKAAHAETDAMRERLRLAQDDKSANAPGAIWNPRIQRLLDLPIVKSGINQGVKLERQNAAAEGRPFNASEHAIIGTDAEGNPVVGKVPNMRLLASAKEGLDAILGSPDMRDPLTGRLTKEGVSVDKVRRALLTELKAANPDYAKALESWAGHSSSMEAIKFGRNLFSKDNSPELIAERAGDMSKSEKEFARIGLADMLREKILRTGIGGDEAKHIIGSEWSRMQAKPLFESDASFQKFLTNVTDERAMFDTKHKVMGGSPTAERGMEDSAALGLDVAHGVGKALGGNIYGAIKSMMAAKRDLGLRQNPQLNEAIARLLFDPDITPEKLGRAAAPKIDAGAAGDIARSVK